MIFYWKVLIPVNPTYPNARCQTLFMLGDSALDKAIRKLEDAVVVDKTDDAPFVVANGKQVFPYLLENPKVMEIFQGYMTQRSKCVLKELIPFMLKVCGDKAGVRVLDVGGGHGAVMEQLQSAAPHYNCSVLDLPHVVEMMAGNQASKIKFVGGDMFDKDTIPEADFVFLKHILHDWSDEDCQKILKNIHNILPDNGSCLIVESYIPDAGQATKEDWLGFSMDLTVMTIGGRERTESQTKEMMEKAGFKVEDNMIWWVPLTGKLSCVVASKVN